ncbi:MAG: hypothetical protein FD179_1957 [Erysipelotrichaceae bacterium]|nr:MAG: hypothetical protein FD179_1957 [Erysipelotrichaceae bacterium]
MGVLFGWILFWVFISKSSNLLFHCVLIGGIFGILNFITAMFFIKRYTSLVNTNQKLDIENRKDSLTDLYNRRAFDRDIRLNNSNVVCSIIFLDVDNFREFNNIYGHQAGDQILVECAKSIKSCIRESDMAYRFGGEEFIVILRQCDKMDAHKIAQKIIERIRKVDNLPFPTITVSAGVATLPEDSVSIEQTVRASDLALLMAKKKGKNQVVLFDRSKMT